MWWAQNAVALARCDNLSVSALSSDATAGLQKLATRAMNLACTVQDRRIWLASDAHQVEIEPQVLQEPARR
jgi:uncharacterized protein YaeQ